jgi:hypothetical protein
MMAIKAIAVEREPACGPAYLYSYANNTKISPLKCTTFEEIFLCLLQHLDVSEGQVQVNQKLSNLSIWFHVKKV